VYVFVAYIWEIKRGGKAPSTYKVKGARGEIQTKFIGE